MSTRKQASKNQSLVRENNERDNIDENTVASHKQSTITRTRNDATSDDLTCNAVRLLGKMSRGKANKHDIAVARETTENIKKW